MISYMVSLVNGYPLVAMKGNFNLFTGCFERFLDKTVQNNYSVFAHRGVEYSDVIFS